MSLLQSQDLSSRIRLYPRVFRLHDTKLVTTSTELYVANVKDCVDILQQACNSLIWIFMSATMGKEGPAQATAEPKNQAVERGCVEDAGGKPRFCLSDRHLQ